MNTRRSFSKPRWMPMLIMMIVLPIILGCSLTGAAAPTPAPIIMPTQAPQVTVLVVVQSPTPEAVLIPTDTLAPTDTIMPAEPTAEPILPTETTAATPLPEYFEYKNLLENGFHFTNSTKCKDEKEGCWILTSYKQEAFLDQEEYIFIDPTWANPYLVFWHKYSSDGYSFFGYLEMTADNEVGWSQKRGYKKTAFDWVEEAFDLNEYKGHEILFRIKFIPTSDAVSKTYTKFNFHDWYISPFRVVPDYQP